MIKNKLHLFSWLILLLVTLPSTSFGSHKSDRFYLSLGTSLAVGIQPDATGENQLTDEGYADQLFGMIKPIARRLKLVKLGCPGETTVTMIGGGLCYTNENSQLTQAINFLQTHGRKVKLVTIDMGVNDILESDCIGTINEEACLLEVILQTTNRLVTIMGALKSVAHPRTKFIGMNYYNTFLAAWLNPALGGPDRALETSVLAAGFNDALESVYGAFGIPTADVARAYLSDRFDIELPFPPFGDLPINVVLICRLTYMCAPSPVGPNIHANPDGYRVIAFAFLLELYALRYT